MGKVLSVEDKSLASSILTSRSKTYSDIDLSFAKKPSGDVYKKSDAAAVKQSVKNIVSTNRFEKPFQPNFGANITGLLFELATNRTSQMVRRQIEDVVYRYEPRAEILDIEVSDKVDQNTLKVKLTFKVVNTEEVVSITTTISRLR